MTEMDELPKMISLSPGPLTSSDEKNTFRKKLRDKDPPLPRHNWDAEVIEVLWQQDVDLGLTRHDFDPIRSISEEYDDEPAPEKVARLEDEWQPTKLPASGGVPAADDSLDELWSGLDYTIDSETGEYVLRLPETQASSPPVVPSTVDQLNSAVDALDEPLLSGPIPTTIEDLISAETLSTQPLMTSEEPAARRSHASGDSGQGSLAGSSDSGDAQIALLDEMIEAARLSTATAQTRQPLMRVVSMEQRWQDLASILLLPSQQAPLPAPLTQQTPLPAPPLGQPTQQTGFVGTTGAMALVSSPLSLTAESLPSPATAGSEMAFCQLSPAAVPTAAEAVPQLDQDAGFLSHLLDVDDLGLTELPIALAPQDWNSSQGVGGASSPPSELPKSTQTDLQELGSYRSSSSPGGAGSNSFSRGPRLPVAQKKHQMYGKRFFHAQDDVFDVTSPAGGGSAAPAPPTSAPASPPAQRYGAEGGVLPAYPPADAPAPSEAATAGEPAELKYSSSAHFTRTLSPDRLGAVTHNHSYHQPVLAESPSEVQRPIARDKAGERKGERLSRDEKRTRAMNIPLTAEEIVQLPMDEFNERLAKHQLTEAQLSLVRDVRRRGKNKLAAQNCRKRKLDQIITLTEDLQKVRDQKQKMLSEHQFLTEERARIQKKYAQLHRHVFESLRDADGLPYSPDQYSLQLSADGDVLLVPRGSARVAVVVPDPASHRTQHDRPE